MLASSSPSSPLSLPRALILALYVVAATFIIPSLMEFMLVSYPYRLGAAQWRFGALGLLFNSVLFSPIVGIALASVAAVMLEQRKVARVLAILGGVIALLMLIGLPFFALDFLQLRASVNPQAKRAFDFTSLKAALTGGLLFLAALSVAIGTWRGSSSPAGQRVPSRAGAAARAKAGPVVMGSAQTPQS